MDHDSPCREYTGHPGILWRVALADMHLQTWASLVGPQRGSFDLLDVLVEGYPPLASVILVLRFGLTSPGAQTGAAKAVGQRGHSLQYSMLQAFRPGGLKLG